MSRRLKPEEAELWRKVAATTTRMHKAKETVDYDLPTLKVQPGARQDTSLSSQPSPPLAPPLDNQKQPMMSGYSVFAAPDIAEQVIAAPVRMDKKKHTRLRRGQLRPEAKLDLHGMTLNQAHPALTRFILTAHAQEKRLVLVITGKGKTTQDTDPIPVRRGILRNAVPGWLATAPLSGVVMQVTTAHQRHGGTGAYYIYLRKQR